MYFSHPSKGLDAALAVLRILRETESRFKLHIFGGNALWGGKDGVISEPGYLPRTRDRKVFDLCAGVNLSLHLQAREEPFTWW